MQTRTLLTAVLTVLFMLACGGTPVRIQVGDAKLEVGADEDGSAGTVADEAATKPAASGTSGGPAVSGGTGTGQIQITTGRLIDPRVDGATMVGTADGFFAEVRPGRRTVTIYNLLGRQRAQTTVNVRSGRRHVLNWNGQLTATGEKAAGRMPEAISYDSEVTISGLLVMDSSATVRIGSCNATRVPGKDAFRCPAVAPGSQPVLIQAGGFELYNGPITVGLGGQTQCTFQLGSGAWVPDCTHYP
jgi:hypothetical protein